MIRISDYVTDCYVCKQEVVSEKKFNEFRRDKDIYVCSKDCLARYNKVVIELNEKINNKHKKKLTTTPEG